MSVAPENFPGDNPHSTDEANRDFVVIHGGAGVSIEAAQACFSAVSSVVLDRAGVILIAKKSGEPADVVKAAMDSLGITPEDEHQKQAVELLLAAAHKAITQGSQHHDRNHYAPEIIRDLRQRTRQQESLPLLRTLVSVVLEYPNDRNTTAEAITRQVIQPPMLS